MLKIRLNWQDEWPIDIDAVLKTQIEHKLTGKCLIDIGAVPKTELKLTRQGLIDIGAVLKIELTRWMTDQYRCGPQNLNRHGRWPINIGTTLKTELTWKWMIDISTVLKIKLTRWMIDWYRCDPNSKTELTRWMTDRYRCGLKNWTGKKNDQSI